MTNAAATYIGSGAGIREPAPAGAIPELAEQLEGLNNTRSALVRAKGGKVKAVKAETQAAARRNVHPKVRADLQKAREKFEIQIDQLEKEVRAAKGALDAVMSDLGNELRATREVALTNALAGYNAAVDALVPAYRTLCEARAALDWLSAYPDRAWNGRDRGLSDPRVMNAEWSSIEDLAESVLRLAGRRVASEVAGGGVRGMLTT